MDEAMVSKLQEGVKVNVVDFIEADEYTVTLKCLIIDNNPRYVFGEGWSTMKWSLDLKEGQQLKLYWDVEDKKFFILNFCYQTIPLMIPV
ncbi:unnamed protein product [Thlaspi arvense]|nr:unnamed protein product [Thlaspi arvense]